jgi:CelD/BcsL family acetyltransferase involved in cellulose biosynthesis
MRFLAKLNRHSNGGCAKGEAPNARVNTLGIELSWSQPSCSSALASNRMGRTVASIRIHTSIRELEQLRPFWESLCSDEQTTIFQNFDWNLLAARIFGRREEPFVVSAEASYGAAIVPAVLRHSDRTVRLLGEELFDYRGFLHDGEDEVLRSALATLGQLESPLEVVAVRECDRRAVMEELNLTPFTAAPGVTTSDITAEKFASLHVRLGRNLRRFQNQGFELKAHSGKNSDLLRSVYERKAAQDATSLFHDRCRIDFIVEAARLRPESCETFTLESGSRLAAALVTFRDDACRRFYTCYFDPEFSKLSPSMTLIHEVTKQSLAAGLSCDYMTGEQPYKLRMATSSVQLYRLQASAEQLAALSDAVEPVMKVA